MKDKFCYLSKEKQQIHPQMANPVQPSSFPIASIRKNHRFVGEQSKWRSLISTYDTITFSPSSSQVRVPPNNHPDIGLSIKTRDGHLTNIPPVPLLNAC